MARYFIVLLAFLLLPSTQAVAQPSRATLKMHAVERHIGHKRLVQIGITIKMNEVPSGPCTITIQGGLSTVGATSPLPIGFRVVTRRQTKERVNRFNFLGNPVNGSESRQTQLNVYAQIDCRRYDFIEFESNYDASNVSCVGGVSRRAFTSELKRRLR